MSFFEEYKERLMEGARNERIRLALSRAIASYRANTNQALSQFPHTVRLADEVREIKERSVKQMEELAEQASKAIRANKGEVFFAKNSKEAVDIISNLVGKGKLIVKGKSLTAEEVELREHLEEEGNEVYETDLGEFIIQKLGSRPMHILSPAIHVPKEDVAALLTRITGEEIPPDIAQEVARVRSLLREKYFQADVGVSGANVVAADTGTLFLIENEGNIRLATSLPPIHIALVGMEKLVPTLHDAWKVAEVTWRYANYTVPSYMSLISGLSKTGDIEKVTTYGAHGPREFYVVFLDGGRVKLANHPLFCQALYCLRCGGCLYECPIFAFTAGYFGDKYFAGVGAIWTAFITGDLSRASPLAYTCLGCGRCRERCPVKIDVPTMIIELRKLLVENASRLQQG